MWPLLSSSQQLGSFEKASAPPGAPWPLWRSQSAPLSHRSLSAQGSPSLTASNASHFSLNPGSVESSAQPPLSPPRLQGLDEPRGGGFSRQARRDAESSSCLWASHVALSRTGQRGRAAHTFGMLRPARPLRSVSSRRPVRYGSRALSGLYCSRSCAQARVRGCSALASGATRWCRESACPACTLGISPGAQGRRASQTAGAAPDGGCERRRKPFLFGIIDPPYSSLALRKLSFRLSIF